MPDRRVSELEAASALTGTETVYVVQSSNSRRTTVQDIANLGGSGASGAASTYPSDNWGFDNRNTAGTLEDASISGVTGANYNTATYLIPSGETVWVQIPNAADGTWPFYVVSNNFSVHFAGVRVATPNLEMGQAFFRFGDEYTGPGGSGTLGYQVGWRTNWWGSAAVLQSWASVLTNSFANAETLYVAPTATVANKVYMFIGSIGTAGSADWYIGFRNTHATFNAVVNMDLKIMYYDGHPAYA